MLCVENLYFEYPGVLALKDVSFDVEPQSITALVGPNGAGKTTLLRCIAALDAPVSGRISFEGVDVLENPRACHERFGYLSDFFGLYDDLTVSQCLTYMAMAHGLPAESHARAVELAAKRVGILDRIGDKAGSLSRGLRQRLAIGQAIIHMPRLVLLDEPASGLDPEARSSLSELFLSLREEGMTLIVSSHIIAELEEYSTHMLILKDGRVVSDKPVGLAAETSLVIAMSLTVPDDRLAGLLGSYEAVIDPRVEGRHARFGLRGDNDAMSSLLKVLVEAGLPVCSFAEEKKDMQSEYMNIVRAGRSAGSQS